MRPEDLAQLSSMPLRAKTIVEGLLTGTHHTRKSGTSIEFAEHKEYALGDDIRHIDWKVAARAERYYVKKFESDAEMGVYLVVDTSGSMAYPKSHGTYAIGLEADIRGLPGRGHRLRGRPSRRSPRSTAV